MGGGSTHHEHGSVHGNTHHSPASSHGHGAHGDHHGHGSHDAHGGHGHHKHYEIPDYRIYKVEGIPVLENVQRRLAAKGLKDPWLRNEVWRYQDYKGPWRSMFEVFSRGLKYAIPLMLLTIAADKVFNLKIGQVEHLHYDEHGVLHREHHDGHHHGDHH